MASVPSHLCDDPTLTQLYIAFVIERGIRRAHLDGIIGPPIVAWGTQFAREPAWILENFGRRSTRVVRDCDAKFTDAFDAVFSAICIEIRQGGSQATTRPDRVDFTALSA